MDLLVQVRSCFYCFLFGFMMLGIYHLFHRLVWYMPFFIKGICHFFIGLFLAYIYYLGLVYVNGGLLYMYYIFFVLLGYLLYQRYYAYYELVCLEKIILLIKKIFHPIIFFLRMINAIIKKRVRKVLRQWQKENQDSKS